MISVGLHNRSFKFIVPVSLYYCAALFYFKCLLVLSLVICMKNFNHFIKKNCGFNQVIIVGVVYLYCNMYMCKYFILCHSYCSSFCESNKFIKTNVKSCFSSLEITRFKFFKCVIKFLKTNMKTCFVSLERIFFFLKSVHKFLKPIVMTYFSSLEITR